MPVIYFRCSGNVDLPVVIPPNDLQSAECASDTVASDFADKIGGEPLGVRELERSFQLRPSGCGFRRPDIRSAPAALDPPSQ
jgi:hypothetical protein